MAEQIEKKHLSETIDYDRDIAPYRFIKIYSGVGSGKNRFIDRLVQGDYFKHADGSYVKKQHVLLVTSRRSKVDEQLNSKDTVYDPNIGIFDGCAWNWLMDDPKYQDYFESPRKTLENSDGWGESTIYCRSCAYTNAKIETNLKLHYSKSERASHVEDYIAENERLPDDLLALLCTSKHKEGINIKNEDISAVFIEAHAKNDVLQMAGRVRTPVPKLYLIANSIPHPDKEKAFESEFSEREDVLAAVNLYFQDM